MQITTTREQAAAHGLKILVHGPAGSGKTRLCATVPDLDHTLILSAEAGLLSLADHEIDSVVIATLDEMREAYVYLRNQNQQAVGTDSDAKRYSWVCIDSLSEIAEVCLQLEKTRTDHGLRAYGEMAEVMSKMIRQFRDLPGINVVFTCKQERINDEGRLVYAPMLPGKQLAQNIAYWFDEVFAMRSTRRDDGTVERWLQTVNDGVYEAKDRSGRLDPAEPADLAAIARKIAGKQPPTQPTANEE